MLIAFILGASILVQTAAAALALRLNWLYGRQWAWKLISLAIVLMTIRRCVTFLRLTSDQSASTHWIEESDTLMASAVLSLFVSILFVVGVALINPIFRRMKQVEAVLAGETDRLQQIVSVNEAEFQIARQVQQQLYPAQDPQIDGFDISGRSIPARSASGDYFDYLPSDNGRYGVVLGDASGHGMGAALLATETRAHLQAAWTGDDDPGKNLSWANRFICNDTTNGQFVTLLLAQLDTKNRTMVTASAGHPTFLLRTSGEIESWDADGVPLGIDCSVTYGSSGKRQLSFGDIVILCSERLWEAHNQENVQFGMQRIFDLVTENRELPSREIVDVLFEAVEQFTGRDVPMDDITVVIVKATDSRDVGRATLS